MEDSAPLQHLETRPWIGRNVSTGELLVRGHFDPHPNSSRLYLFSLESFERKTYQLSALGASVQEITDPEEYETAYTLYQGWPDAKAARDNATAATRSKQVTDKEQEAIEQRARDLTLSNEETWIPSTDAEFHRWRKAHPGGYVLNAPRSSAATSSKLHVSVECMHIANHRNTKDNALTRGARKVCAERVEALRAWFRVHVSDEATWEPCSTCGSIL